MPSFAGPFASPLGGDFTYNTEGVAKGAASDSAEDILRKHLNPALKGEAWDAIIAAMATGDETNRQNARSAFDQLFTSTASGVYLTRRASDLGVQKPFNIGMPDELFRQYAIRTTNAKLTEESLLEIMEIFYGVDSVRAYADSLPESFALEDGDDLTVRFDEQYDVTILFEEADFTTIDEAKAVEVAAALTRAFRFNELTAYAIPVVDPETGSTSVRIYSGSRGLGSSVRIVGGKAQTIFQFPSLIDAVPAAQPTWTLTFDATTNRLRFSPNSNFNIALVQVGDYVTVYGDMFNVDNRGTWQIVETYWAYPGGVLTQWFEVVNANGVAEGPLVQLQDEDLMVFRPTRRTVHTTPEKAVVVTSLIDEINIVLPATSQAVGREATKAAYGMVADGVLVSLTTLERTEGGTVTVDTVDPHGLVAGGQVLIDNVYGAPTIPPVVAGTIAGNGGTSQSSKGSIWSTLAPAVSSAGYHACSVRLNNGRALIVGGDTGPNAYVFGVGTAQLTGVTTAQTFRINSLTELSDTRLQASYDSLVAAALPAARSFGAMTLGSSVTAALQNKAVFTGGTSNGLGVANNVYAYTPDTNTWSSLANLGTARCAHAQTTLNDGKILVTGGTTAAASAIALSSCERYNPATNTWSAAASMNDVRAQHEQVKLLDGRVMVIGGRSLSGGDLVYDTGQPVGGVHATCEIYDPTGNTWTKTGRMAIARWQHSATVLPDGRVLVVGGIGFNPTQPTTDPQPLKDAEIWNPTTGAWQPAGRTAFERDTPLVTYLASKNQVVVTGGSASTTTELFDPVKIKWRLGSANLPSKRVGAKAVLLEDDLVWIGGGIDATTKNIGTVLSLYLPNADSFLGGGLNGIFRVTEVVDANTFKFETPDETQYTLNASEEAFVTPLAAPDDPGLGPYIFDPDAGLAVTAHEAAIEHLMAAGQQYASVRVDDASDFPDEEGWLVFGLGYEYEVAPVRYFGRLSDTTLSLDFKFRFPKTVPVGAKVTLLANKGAFVPEHPEQVGSFYITDSPAGRVAAGVAVDAAVGAGVPVVKEIVYPGDRGLGGEGLPASGTNKLSDKVAVWAGSDVDGEVAKAREG